jgi:hypothetical protein
MNVHGSPKEYDTVGLKYQVNRILSTYIFFKVNNKNNSIFPRMEFALKPYLSKKIPLVKSNLLL